MNYRELKKTALKSFLPALILEGVFPALWRVRIQRIVTVVLFFLGLVAIILFSLEHFPEITQFLTLGTLPFTPEYIYAFFFFLLAFQATVLLLNAFSAYYYFRGLDTILHEHGRGEKPHISFEVAQIVYNTSDSDVTKYFTKSFLGKEIFLRCGITHKELKKWRVSRKIHLKAGEIKFHFHNDITLHNYAEAIVQNDEHLLQFLFEHGIQKEQFVGAARFIEQMSHENKKKARWWSRDNMGRISGIGKSWAYGKTYLLEQYGGDIKEHSVYASTQSPSVIGHKEVLLLETILSRTNEANVMLVSEGGVETIEIVARFARRIYEGRALPPIEHKVVMLFDSDALIATKKEKGLFEEAFLKLLDEATRAGNIILVIKNFSSFIENARIIGVNAPMLLEPYFTSSALQIIATSSSDSFHRTVEPNTQLMRHLERILVEKVDRETIMNLLKNTALEVEPSYKIFFTYTALEEIALSVSRYFPVSDMSHKAVDLLYDSIQEAAQKKKRIVNRSDILSLIEAKTGIPIGETKDEEKEMFLRLEQTLHQHIVGQEEAVKAVANTMRRARAGIVNPNRPVGSFLFFGPTGVGKTETAKILADVFFGNREKMLRFDMSEYSTPEALNRLIGSFESGEPGTLASAIREGQHGLLLLDEFEKAHQEVHNLFLQILDEGNFSDAHGKKVNVRNFIIVATSNAGSDFIWKHSKDSGKHDGLKKELINMIIEQGIFAPELLNRFDDTIMFHSLGKADIRIIAGLLLKKLRERLKKQGVDLVIDDALLSMLVREGYDSRFGARPMHRVIREKVEQVIADKLLRGEIKSGEQVEIEIAHASRDEKGWVENGSSSKDDFVFVVAHELRSPITAIRGYLSMILEGSAGPVQSRLEKFLKPMERAGDHLSRLVDDLLEIARSNAGTLEVVMVPTSIDEAISQVLTELTPSAQEMRVAFTYVAPSESITVLADVDKLRGVISNFVTNAIKYNHIGGTVTITHEEKSDTIVTHISDTGVGISQENQKHIFEKFFREKRSEVRETQGTGLGLFITKEIVEKMDGSVWFNSEEGVGTTFSFSLKKGGVPEQ